MLLAIGEGVAVARSAPNRIARKQAKQQGDPPPPKDGWYQLAVFLAPILITVTLLVLYKWLFMRRLP